MGGKASVVDVLLLAISKLPTSRKVHTEESGGRVNNEEAVVFLDHTSRSTSKQVHLMFVLKKKGDGGKGGGRYQDKSVV